MSELNWSEFWWSNITGPRELVEQVTESLLNNRMVVLAVPTDLPWRHAMRCTINNVFRDREDVHDIVIEHIDVADDNPEGKDPGYFILERFSSGEIFRGYRSKSKITIQDYITVKKVLENQIIWVKGLRGTTAQKWLNFCRSFNNRTLHDGLFVLEIQGDIPPEDLAPLELINFSEYVNNYDVQLFNSFVLDKQDQYDDLWKRYIAAVVASICDIDAEVSATLLEKIDFEKQNLIKGIRNITGLHERRGTDDCPKKHILWYSRNERKQEIERRLWRAQIQVLYPLIEMERVSLIHKWHDKIQDALDSHIVLQFNERLLIADYTELGSLFYMVKNQILDIPNSGDRDWISLLRNCRNNLAHAKYCSADQVSKLLNALIKNNYSDSVIC